MADLSSHPPPSGPAAADGHGIVFTRVGMARGAAAILPIGAAAAVFGGLFGFLAGAEGLSVLEALLMSGIVFAGASQFVALDLWQDPLPILVLAVSVLAVNLRHVLMGATLAPYLSRLPRHQAYPGLLVMTDETWALTNQNLRAGGRDAGFLFGAGLTIYLLWTAATLGGRLFGAALPSLDGWGIGFLITAFFLALLGGFWRGSRDVLPWAVAGGVAILCHQGLGGHWHIVIGAVCGSCGGAWRHAR